MAIVVINQEMMSLAVVTNMAIYANPMKNAKMAYVKGRAAKMFQAYADLRDVRMVNVITLTTVYRSATMNS